MYKAVRFPHLSRHKACHSIYEVLPLPVVFVMILRILSFFHIQKGYLQPIITQYFIDNKSEIWLLFLIAHSKR